MKKDLVIIGGGPAGLAAAVEAYDQGVHDILILERDSELGGILNQCIHNGFGLHTFKEELTGPEYALRYVKMVKERKIPFMLRTMAVKLKGGEPIKITAMCGDERWNDRREEVLLEAENEPLAGLQKGAEGLEIEAKAVVLAMGCRERARGALNIPGYRPAGIFTAGSAQRFVNIEGLIPGREVVVLGSGDIGLIMARRMKLQGADVKMVVEIMPYSGGLKRNIVQCLEDFNIPLKLSHTIVDIDGKHRLKGVTIAQVDEAGKELPDTAEYIKCDTLLLSCGLIPENELSIDAGIEMDRLTHGPVVNDRMETGCRGIFSCGNVLHVHDLVDNVSKEAKAAGKSAAEYVLSGAGEWGKATRPKSPPKSRYTPTPERDFTNQLICIGCPVGCLLTVNKRSDGQLEVTGNSCPVGAEYGRKEMTAPTRPLTASVKVTDGIGAVVSVKTSADIPKNKIMECMAEIGRAKVSAPVVAGDILLKDIAGTGVHIIATANMLSNPAPENKMSQKV
ncbi:MAG: FAD-dependent oxidoreductase [Lachnospiraceae bacterium]|nr:FAD-dependent oxidoreductase [Lachnospiraceae bacterium]